MYITPNFTICELRSMTVMDPLSHIADVFATVNVEASTPRQDDRILQRAGVSLDRALIPLLACLGTRGPMAAVELADRAGRDSTTISRQLLVLEMQGLVERRPSQEDRRVKEIFLTVEGSGVAERLIGARRQLYSGLLSTWTAKQWEQFVELAHEAGASAKKIRDQRSKNTDGS